MLSDSCRLLYRVLMRPKGELKASLSFANCFLLTGLVQVTYFYWATLLVKVCSVCIISILAIKGRL